MENTEIWKFLAGLGFFLYGMNQLETVLKNTSGRSFKLFLKKNTQSLFKSIFGGAIVTGIVQSSSVVSLIVLAFVESGIITFRNALGVILGTNLGTTLDSWIVATIGFKLNILNYSLPVIAITAIGMFFFEKKKKLHNLLAIFFALGILFLGLGFIKEGGLALVKEFDLKAYAGLGTFAFVIIGFLLTTIIQSSSATIAIALTAIYTGILTLPSAAAVVIGSEVGTTIKILLWGMKGSAGKKRVAWGNFIYNIFTAGIALISLQWLIHFIENVLLINDPLIQLVFFQTSINTISIVLFIPFLNIFSKWLERKFTADNTHGYSYISKNLPLLPVLAPDSLKNEAKNLLVKTLQFNKNILCSESVAIEGLFENIKSFTRSSDSTEEEYKRLKQTEGDILGYYAAIQIKLFDKIEAELMMQYLDASRQSIIAAKSVKDIAHNSKEFAESSNDAKHQAGELIQEEWLAFDGFINSLLSEGNTHEFKNLLDSKLKEILTSEERQKSEVFAKLKNNQLNEVEASTLMNVYRELLLSKKSLLSALRNLEPESLNTSK
ncbi:MAG: Na/Pi cotransporter family protein [Saprospiraceae bacterium]|nr:Na/Pi cotransporter family protein [Saprospiraceae bacterium]